MEDGVEVIVNHLEPYKIKKEPTTLNLEEEFIVDFERDDLAELSLTAPWGFAVDSDGNLYFVTSKTRDNCIFKFDRNVNFITSFGRRGQGPGEL